MAWKIDWDETRAKTDLAFDIFAAAVGVILGLAMMGQGGYKLYQGIDDGADALYYLGHTVMVLAGIAVTFLSAKDRVKMTGAYAIGLGISRFLLRWNDINNTDNPRLIFVEVIFMMLALNLVRIGSTYARGKVVSQLSMTLTASILLSTDILLIVVDQYVDDLLSFLPFGIDSYFYAVNALMYAALIGLLDSRFIRENTELARQAKILDRVRSAYSIEETSFVTRDVADCLLGRSGPLWKEINDGTVQSEMEFRIVHEETRASAVAQIWNGKDTLYITVVSEGDSIFNANRFGIDELVESEGALCGYGKDGTRFRVMIKGGDGE
ncbi:MAG: hypothetical protein J6Y18_02515 [Candidatus Methanomethylophilaceae archaeon]|nr:hypothetical protein [Candidatus Methanomethylophilaceae archaeon]